MPALQRLDNMAATECLPSAKLRARSESEDSEDSGILLVASDESLSSQKDGKASKNRPKKLLKSEKCDKENEKNSNQTASKDAGQTKKKSKTIIKGLEDVASLLLNSDRRKIAIPVKLIEKLVFLPNFGREQSLEAAQKSLAVLVNGLSNIRGALILDSEQARHLDRVRTMIDASHPDSFSALIEMKSDQQVDAAVARLARSNGSHAVIKLARLLKEDGAGMERPTEEAVSQSNEPRRQRSNTVSSLTRPPLVPNRPMPKRHSLGGNSDQATLPNSNSPGRIGRSSDSLIRLPIGPGSDGFRPEARLRL